MIGASKVEDSTYKSCAACLSKQGLYAIVIGFLHCSQTMVLCKDCVENLANAVRQEMLENSR